MSEDQILATIEERVNAELGRLKKLNGENAVKGKVKAPFSDISEAWGREYIEEMYAKAWIGGYEDGTFRPNAHITRAEAAKTINAFMGRIPDKAIINGLSSGFTDLDKSHWAYYEIVAATTGYTWQREK